MPDKKRVNVRLCSKHIARTMIGKYKISTVLLPKQRWFDPDEFETIIFGTDKQEQMWHATQAEAEAAHKIIAWTILQIQGE